MAVQAILWAQLYWHLTSSFFFCFLIAYSYGHYIISNPPNYFLKHFMQFKQPKMLFLFLPKDPKTKVWLSLFIHKTLEHWISQIRDVRDIINFTTQLLKIDVLSIRKKKLRHLLCVEVTPITFIVTLVCKYFVVKFIVFLAFSFKQFMVHP